MHPCAIRMGSTRSIWHSGTNSREAVPSTVPLLCSPTDASGIENHAVEDRCPHRPQELVRVPAEGSGLVNSVRGSMASESATYTGMVISAGFGRQHRE